jgi:chloride channel protein, CIC family
MMKSTIMTEKIARRGITTPESYVPDILKSYKVGHVLKEEVSVLGVNNTLGDARKFILENAEKRQFTTFAIVDEEGDLYGLSACRKYSIKKTVKAKDWKICKNKSCFNI